MIKVILRLFRKSQLNQSKFKRVVTVSFSPSARCFSFTGVERRTRFLFSGCSSETGADLSL